MRWKKKNAISSVFLLTRYWWKNSAMKSVMMIAQCGNSGFMIATSVRMKNARIGNVNDSTCGNLKTFSRVHI